MALSGIPKNTHFLWHVQKNVFFRKSRISRSGTPDTQLDQPLSSIDHFLWQTTLPMTGQIGDLKFWISDNEPRVWGRFLVGQRGETPLFFQHLLCFSGVLEACRKKGKKTHFFHFFFPKIWHFFFRVFSLFSKCFYRFPKPAKARTKKVPTFLNLQIFQIFSGNFPNIFQIFQIFSSFSGFSQKSALLACSDSSFSQENTVFR